MMPGPELLIACPACDVLAKVFSPGMGDSYGAIIWSDGFRDAPMMPRPPRITRCHHCAHIFWVGAAIPCGYLDPESPNPDPAWTSAPYVAPLDEAGFLEAVASGAAHDTESELELRVAAWWRGNDRFRVDPAQTGHPTSEQACENLARIIELTAEGDETLLLFRAEALRHLGRFAEVETTLEGVVCSDFRPAKTKQLDWTRSGNRDLHVLFEDGPLPSTPEPEA